MFYVNVRINGIDGHDDIHNIQLKTWLRIYTKPIIEQYGFIRFIKFTYEVIKGDDE